MAPPRRRRRLRDRRIVQVIAALLVVALIWLSWSIGTALTTAGGGSFAQRMAEWARGHYLGPVVTLGEWLTYSPPKVGGKPSFSLAGPSAAANKTSGTPPVRHRPRHYPAPHRLASPAGRPLPGEGAWRVAYSVKHHPAIYTTFLRPDKVHTSYVAGIVNMNQKLLKFQLRPGVEDPGPGGYGGAQPVIAPGHRRGLAATFNGGFKIASAQGGFWLHGTQRGPLIKGAASMVYYRDGSMRIGVWGSDLHMTPDVVGVRQNLRPIVEHGQIPATVDQNVQSSWGATLGGGYYVWRSGIGVTNTGQVIFVYGPALDVRTLASLLKRAGCVEAMELDINPDWTNFMYYKPGHHPADPTPVNLLPDQVQPATRYYALANRDFTAVFAR
ncbi:MAG TPA: hypothetical protein VHU92_29740 [Streptosporangiaceae bacterium]|nr:hypothetical protein [Streptosporangiaceae bacterium]